MVTTTASGAASRSAVRPTASVARTIVLLVAGIVVAAVATTIVALTASALGATVGFAPLSPAVYLPAVALMVVVAHVGWRIVRARVARPLSVLRVLVPVLLLLSWIPDVVLLATGFVPGATVTGAIALMLMHPIVVAVAVGVSQRIAPVTD